MNPFVKGLLDRLVKPTVDKEIAQLKADRDANVTQIEAALATGATTAESAVTGFIASKLKGNQLVTMAEDLLLPTLESGLTTAIGGSSTEVGALYDSGLAWLEKEDALL